MKLFMQTIVFGIFAIIMTGCATAKVENAQIPGEKVQSKVVHNSFYGFHWSSNSIAENSRVYRVTTKTNMLYSFVSVISIGLYVPQELEWSTVTVLPPPDRSKGIKIKPRK